MTVGGGGMEIASAYVSVGIDLSTARSGIAELKSELASLTGSNYAVGGGGAVPAMGSVTPMSLPSAGAFSMSSSSVGQVGMVPAGSSFSISGGGASAVVQEAVASISQQTQAAMAQVVQNIAQQFAGALAGVAGRSSPGSVVPTANRLSGNFSSFGPEIPSPFSGNFIGQATEIQFHGRGNRILGDAASVMASEMLYSPFSDNVISEAEESTGGAVAGRGRSRAGLGYVNPFSARGLSRLVGSGLAVYGGLLALSTASEFADAASEEPLVQRRIQRNYDGLGRMANPMNVAGAVIMNRAAAQQHEDEIGVFESLPVIGTLLSAFDYRKKERQEERDLLDQQISMSVALPEMRMDARISQARSAGNPVAAARLEADKQRQKTSEDLRRVRTTFGNDESASQVIEAKDIFRRTVASGDLDVAHAEGELAAMPFEVESKIQLQSHDFGSGFRSLQLRGDALSRRQAAEMGSLERAAARAQGRLFRGPNGLYVGSSEDIAAYNDAKGNVDTARRRQKLEQDELGGEEADLRWNADNAAFAAQGRVRSLAARAGNDDFSASMIDFETSSEIARRQAASLGVNLTPAIDAERNIRMARHRFDRQVEIEGYDARIDSAQERAAYRPMTANADMEVARARHEIAMASPEARSQAIAANTAELQAQMKLLTAQRGGDTGVDMSMHEALGLFSSRSVDLSGRQLDIARARGAYQQGINGLANSPQAPQTDPQMLSLVGQILAWLKGQKNAGAAWPAAK